MELDALRQAGHLHSSSVSLRAAGEATLPKPGGPEPAAAGQPNPSNLNDLVSIGYTENGANQPNRIICLIFLRLQRFYPRFSGKVSQTPRVPIPIRLALYCRLPSGDPIFEPMKIMFAPAFFRCGHGARRKGFLTIAAATAHGQAAAGKTGKGIKRLETNPQCVLESVDTFVTFPKTKRACPRFPFAGWRPLPLPESTRPAEPELARRWRIAANLPKFTAPQRAI